MSNVSLREDVVSRLREIQTQLKERTGVDVTYSDVVIKLLEHYPQKG